MIIESWYKWVLNINAGDKAGLTKLGRTEVIKGATLDEAMAKAKRSCSAATSPRAGAPDARKPSQGHRDAKEESREQIDRAHSYARRNPLRTK